MAARVRAMTVALAVVLGSGCDTVALRPLEMKAVEVGTTVNADGVITNPTRVFAPDDTVHMSIRTIGGGDGTLNVRWIVDNQIAHEERRDIDPRGEAHTAFQFKPANGWPIGTSRALFWMNDGEKHTVAFEVRG
jgi:hypothetical protein